MMWVILMFACRYMCRECQLLCYLEDDLPSVAFLLCCHAHKTVGQVFAVDIHPGQS